MSQVLEIKFLQVLQLLLLGFAERFLDQLAGGIGAEAPALAEVFRDVALFAGAERAERAAQKHQRAAKLLLVERLDVAGELFPERLPRQERVAIALGQPLEPAGAE